MKILSNDQIDEVLEELETIYTELIINKIDWERREN